jgi:hypothetical protein
VNTATVRPLLFGPEFAGPRRGYMAGKQGHRPGNVANIFPGSATPEGLEDGSDHALLKLTAQSQELL